MKMPGQFSVTINSFTTHSKSGLTNLKPRVTFDKVGTFDQHALKLNLKHSF
jgi:hypothetical protein